MNELKQLTKKEYEAIKEVMKKLAIEQHIKGEIFALNQVKKTMLRNQEDGNIAITNEGVIDYCNENTIYLKDDLIKLEKNNKLTK